MQRLIATKEVKYAGVVHKVGETFEASDEDARLLKGWDKAQDAAPQSSDDAGKDTIGKGKRNYRRRDMVAED